MKAVILAAGMGTRLESVSGGLPKCMVEVGGRPIIDRMIERIGQAGIDQVVVVTGFKADVLASYLAGSEQPLARAAVLVHNERYAEWGNFYSKLVAETAVGDDGFVAFDGDVVMDQRLLPTLLAAPGPIALAVDCRPGLGDEEMKVRVDDAGRVVALNKQIDPARALGEFVGVERVDRDLAPRVFAALRSLIDRGETHDYYERAYEHLMADGVTFQVADITGCTWGEVDDAADLAAAAKLVGKMPG
jgi:choline kinase